MSNTLNLYIKGGAINELGLSSPLSFLKHYNEQQDTLHMWLNTLWEEDLHLH